MNYKTLVERQMVAGDIHAGTYADLNRQIEALQSRIETLEAALRNAPELHEYGSKREIAEIKGVGRSFVDAWRNWLITARKTLENKP